MFKIETRYHGSWKPIVYIADGVQAHAEKRFRCIPVFDAHGYEVRYLNPVGDYDHHSAVDQVAADMIETAGRPVTLLGASMGARTLFDVMAVLEQRGASLDVRRFIGIDPLFGGDEIKVPGSRLLVQLGKLPGADRLSWLPGMVAGKDSPDDSEAAKEHHAYSRSISVRRWSQEVAASLRPAPTWRPERLKPDVRIILSGQDDILTGEGGQRYIDAFGGGQIKRLPDMLHVRVPEHPDVYGRALEWAFSS